MHYHVRTAVARWPAVSHPQRRHAHRQSLSLQVRAFKAQQNIPDELCFVPDQSSATTRRGLLGFPKGEFEVLDDGREWVSASEAGWMFVIIGAVVVTMVVMK